MSNGETTGISVSLRRFWKLLTNSLILNMLSESKRTVFASQMIEESIVRQLKHLH